MNLPLYKQLRALGMTALAAYQLSKLT